MTQRKPALVVFAAMALLTAALATTDSQTTRRSTDLVETESRSVTVASKPFGESYLLCEMFAQLIEAHGFSVERRPGLGATEIAFGALRSNAIDVYPEYTGTGLVAILHDTISDSLAADPRAVFNRVSQSFAQLYHVRC